MVVQACPAGWAEEGHRRRQAVVARFLRDPDGKSQVLAKSFDDGMDTAVIGRAARHLPAGTQLRR